MSTLSVNDINDVVIEAYQGDGDEKESVIVFVGNCFSIARQSGMGG